LGTAIGAFIGAAASVATMLVQSRRQSQVELKKTAVQLAYEDFRYRIQDQTGRVDALPAFALIYYYDKLVDLVAHDKLNTATVQALIRDQLQLQSDVQKEVEKLRTV